MLVTHHIHFLHRCDKVVVLEGGEIKHYGKYSDLIEQGVDFVGAVDFEENTENTANTEQENEKSEAVKDDVAKKAKVEHTEESRNKKAEMQKKGGELNYYRRT